MSKDAGKALNTIPYGRKTIEVRIRRSNRKTLGITIRPDKSVVVTAPMGAEINAIRARVQRRAGWIVKQQAFFEKYLPTLPPRRYVSGETHRYLGRQYRLKVIEASVEQVKLKGRFIWVHVERGSESRRVKALLERWYLSRARMAFARSLAECQQEMNGCLQNEVRFRLRRMATRWGSCTKAGLILLNPELIKAPSPCVDYVITHEMCHLLHPNHGQEFYRLLRKLMPDWEQRKARLEMALSL